MSTQNPIFYDQNRRRWKITKIVLYCISLIFVSGLIGILLGILIQPKLPANASKQTKNNNAVAAIRTWYPTDPELAYALSQKQYLPNIKDVSTIKTREIYAFYQLSDFNSMQSFMDNGGNIDQVIIDSLYLKDLEGNISEENVLEKEDLITEIENEQLSTKIIPTISNYEENDFSSDKISAIFLNEDVRNTNINSITDYLKSNDFEAVNISFIDVPAGLQQSYTSYLQNLADKLHEENKFLYVTLSIDDNSYDYVGISKIADRIILTGYSQTLATDQPGPIASQAWLVQVYAKRIAQIPQEKIVLGLANFGYDWTSGVAKTITYAEAMNLAGDNNVNFQFDSNALNPHFAFVDANNQKHEIWFLDAATLFNGIIAGEKTPPAGYALWSLGSEDPSVWNFFKKDLNLKINTDLLKDVPVSNNAIYDGEKSILRVVKFPFSGEREYRLEKNLIIDEKYLKFPSSYEIETADFVNNKKIVLTFDDGPDKTYTPQIMDVLKKYNVPATFFVIGSSANDNPAIMEQLSKDFEIGNHTYTHPNINRINARTLEYELNATQRVIENLAGRHTVLFRSPYATDSDAVKSHDLSSLVTLSNLGYFNVPIGADSLDWQKTEAKVLAERVIDGVKNNNDRIILFHDGGGNRTQTVKALPMIIEQLKKDGYEFSTVQAATGISEELITPKTSGTVFSSLNSFGYRLVDEINAIVWVIFFIGIILGIARFVMLTSFATTGWFRSRKYFSHQFKPKVSVIISAFNEENVIQRTVDAVLTSDYENMEIILVNDGSSDNTLQIMKMYYGENEKIKILTHQNKGKAASLNRGIRTADGAIIVTLDADTIFNPDTISLLVRHFDDPRVGAVAGNAKVGNRINLLTKLQALEYITSQSHDRRAFGLVNSITVVPGAIGAWRKSAISECGGFKFDTLAEDADLTVEILKKGYIIETEQNALAYTEAPDNLKTFLKQRFRWVFGTLQVGWKNRKIMFKPKYGLVAFFGIPNILIFQLFFSILAPIVDLMILLTIILSIWHFQQHPAEFSLTDVAPFFAYYAVFALCDFATAFLAFWMEKRENKWLLLWLPLQRFFYRQLVYYVTWKALVIALRGKFVLWEKIIRKNTVQVLPVKA